MAKRNLIATVRRARRLEGEVRLPGDKSISHRALILGALADGWTRVHGLSTGADVRSTASCLRALGADIEESAVRGFGLDGMRMASGPLDCGNSGTTMRLLAGVLAAQGFVSELTGDESLARRPMDRVVNPLVAMGAGAQWPPLRVGGRVPLHGIEYRMPVASAQVKSALLLAGLFAEGTTTVIEPVRTRNHTELMLKAMGVDVRSDGVRVEISKADKLEPLDMEVPGDLSAASFWMVAGGLVPGSTLVIPGAGVNPTRTAFLELLRASGFDIEASGERVSAGEPIADLEVHSASELRALNVGGETAAEMIDELLVLAVAATQLPGESQVSGAAELHVKESDRIAAMADGLATMGANIRALDDGWTIAGPCRLQGARVHSHGDHRVAMALGVAGLLADGVTEIEGAECVEISYPGFFDQLESLV
ncbi:MAG: 3-phosphoshikimate 1-carboxyvinyltransferase [Candidatus Dormibacteraeota bacterium]|nr:3-phosphoshikimate 1-carboxyvinyltransferase [Candidatus Dormibacteraeota bacterium]